MLLCREEVFALTKKLVQTNSVVNLGGEIEMSQVVHDWIKKLPYFKKNPTFVRYQQTIDDDIERYNVIAFVKGTKEPSDKTVLLMGHMDTVGIEDFNHLKTHACNPDELMNALKLEPLPTIVTEHLESGEYLFGRGTLDMKSGVASNLYLLKYYSEHPEKLKGNLVVITECDEEDGSRGILSALKELITLREENGFDYIGAVNADFVTPRFDGDENRYIYKGTVGKLLPSFFITGEEVHVGTCFDGIDPNFIVAELTKQISYNPDLCNEAYGEVTVPPVSLKQTDLKPTYTVQTALSAFVYYNFFVHSWSPQDVLVMLKEQAEIAFQNALDEFKRKYEQYSKLSNQPVREITWKPRVYIYEELDALLTDEHGETYINHMKKFKEDLMAVKDLDTRMFAARVVEEACKWMSDQQPVIILFYSSLYSPRIEVTGKDENEQNLLNALDEAIKQVQPAYEHPIVTKNFFPYISDASFMALSDDEDGIDAVMNNNPGWGTKHFVNYEDIRAINVPVINIGPYGYDGHKQYERTEIKFSHEIVPNLTHEVIQRLLN
ncbi:M20/M25/M40 family metallo-hydrolase [Sporosarcina siberiensis]|uniref:M20/M25/M40 family metallo-hydrolase n=1 Tax=Sporosarcina siberiensis TaxID=1365606 RepID=A0ABW4SD78_9BACL